MKAPLIRIALRYGAAALVAHGWLAAGDGATLATDPDVQMLLGAAVGLGVEAWYWLAHRFGWAK